MTYKFYKKNDYDIMEYVFFSLTDYIDYLDNTPVNYSGLGTHILKSESKDYSFCQTKSLEEAKELCKFGYKEDYEKLIDLKIKLEKFIKLSTTKKKQYNYYVGFAPDVKAYLEGNPLSMLNKTNNIRKKVDIYMNSAYSYFVSSKAIFNRGVIILTLIEILESLGFGVDFHLFEMSYSNNMIHYSSFLIKKETERINPLKFNFPLCNPSWIRRLNFRLKEETPDITSSWSKGYGCPCRLETIEKIIDLNDNDIVLPTISELGILGNNLVDDVNVVFSYINKHSENDFKLEYIKKN